MRIQKTATEGRHESTSSEPKTGKAERFSKVLEEKRKESAPQFNLLAEGERSGVPEITQRSEGISSAPASAEIERLASEIVDHISSHRADGMRSVEIQFNSKTLEGLRVSVRSEQGSIAINFLTSAARIAGLVQNNLGNLRSALESKGIRVTQLSVRRLTG